MSAPEKLASSTKAALLEQLAPLFPRVEPLAAQSLKLNLDTFDLPELVRRERVRFEDAFLPYWLALAPAYAAALAHPFGNDGSLLATSAGLWPSTVAGQQAQLHEHLATSKLRSTWHQYCQHHQQWLNQGGGSTSDNDDKVRQPSAVQRQMLSDAMVVGDKPIREIPLYQGWLRISCQQLVCMPRGQWLALNDDNAVYSPSEIDTQTVNRLTTRLAQVFNTPPLVPLQALQATPSWQSAVVWPGSQDLLTRNINQHGMRDRWLGEHDWPVDDAASVTMPEWRYMGFCGQIDVTLEDGTPWMVCVLAPDHFIYHLMTYAYW